MQSFHEVNHVLDNIRYALRARGPKVFVDLEKKNQKLGLEKLENFLSPQNFRSSRSNFF